MRLLHTADLHLGKVVNEISMLEDQKYILEEILQIADEKKADAILISGDIYDRSIPPEGAVGLLSDFLTALSQRKLPVFLISGNHDSDARLAFGSPLFEKSGICIAGTFDGAMKSYTLTDEYGPVHFYLLPYVKASTVRYFYPDEEIRTYEDAVSLVIQKAGINTAERNVCLAHQFVTGDGKDPELSGAELLRAEEVGTVEKVGSSVFAPFDYTALGHIHGPQRAGSDVVRYSGSPLKYSLREIGQNKSVTLISLGEKKDGRTDTKVEQIPLHPLREMRRIRGHLKDLILHAEDTDDYIYAILTDEEPIPDAMNVLRDTYPNAMRLEYDNAHTRSLSSEDSIHSAGDRSFSELIQDFSNRVLDRDLSEAEKKLIEEAAKEAGILAE